MPVLDSGGHFGRFIAGRLPCVPRAAPALDPTVKPIRHAFSTLGLGALLLVGCATSPSGRIAGFEVPAGAKVAFFTTPTLPYDGIDLDGSFLAVLRRYGLTPTSSGDAAFVVQIGFAQPDPATVVCSLVLFDGKKSLISASGSHRDPAMPEPGAAGDKDREAADRVSAFLAARQDFEGRARGAGPG
jgi:hypothetical protein